MEKHGSIIHNSLVYHYERDDQKMNPKFFLPRIIEEFDEWYQNDIHSKNIDDYQHTITKENLNTLTDSEFLNFFFEFVCDGGKVQTGGHRKKNDFLKAAKNDFKAFKSFVLEPFETDFNLKSWLERRKNFKGFGDGIATIYLNRVDRYQFPIMNNKTLNALNKLGYKISSTKNYSNYQLIKKTQDELIYKFKLLDNYFKADALNHFLIEIYQGKELISEFQQFELLEDLIEQNEIEYKTKKD